MKILLTGATGFVGRNLLPELLKNYNVRCIVRKPLNIRNKNLQLCFGDIRKADDVDKCVKDINCIIHTAATIQGTDKEIFEANINGTENLINAAKKFKIKKFIFISSENVIYDYCDDAYTNSKREAEKLVRNLSNYTILRPSIIYGRDDDRYISYLIKLIKRYPIIPVLGKGENVIQPVYIKDVVKSVINSIKLNIKREHLVYGADAVSYKDIIRKIQNILGVRRFIVYMPLILLKPIIFVYNKLVKNAKIKYKSLEYLKYDRKHDSSYIYKIFKYKPLSLEDGIKETIR